MDIYTFLMVVGLTGIMTIIGLVKRAGIFYIFAMLVSFVATGEQLIDGSLTIPFGTCFAQNSTAVACSTINATISGDMPLLLLAMITSINAILLIRLAKE